MTDHASDFPKPPVPIAELTTLKDAFDEAMVEMTDAAPSTTAAKNAARKALVDALRKNARVEDANSFLAWGNALGSLAK